MTTSAVPTREQLWASAVAKFDGVSRLQVLPGGLANVVARVDTEDGSYVLRLYLQDDQERFRHELAVLQHLAELSIPAPRVRLSGLRCEEFDTPYLAYDYLPGCTLTQRGQMGASMEDLERQIAAAIAAATRTGTLAEPRWGYLHDCSPVHRPQRLHHEPERYLETIRQHQLLPSQLLKRLHAAVQVSDDVLATDHPCLVHPDLKPENILIGTGGPHLIDWELTIGGHPLLAYGGLLAEGLCEPTLRPSLVLHLRRLDDGTHAAAVQAGLLRALEALSYLPRHAEFHQGRRVRRGAQAIATSVHTLMNENAL